MEIATDINRWLLNPVHRPLDSVECRSLRWHKVFELCLSKSVRSLRIFSNLDARSHLLTCCVKHFRVCRNGRVLVSMLSGRSRCREDFADKLSEQKPYTGIGRNRKSFLFDGCHGIVERICRICVLAESLSVVRKQSVRCTLAGPFNESVKVLWPKSMGDFKSITTIFSHNLLYLFALQQFTHKLMGH